MAEEDIISSSIKRMAKIGGLVGQVGLSILSEKTLSWFRSDTSKETSRIKNLVDNANRIVETLGKLKGAAMKAGQMLSLYEGFFPQEVTQILSKLQKEAPFAPFEVMEAEVKNELKEKFAQFKKIEPIPYAAASIGQVHRAVLQDGTKVALKIQYPMMDAIIQSDLQNLKILLSALFSIFTNIDVEPVWEELKERLMEEICYTKEQEHIQKMAELHAPYPEIVIPKIYKDLSSQRVLTMELVEGISGHKACSKEYPQELKNTWAQHLLSFTLRGLMQFQYLHADPNLANFAFLPDGRIIVYDFGCIKKVPMPLSKAWAGIILSVMENRREDIPEILKGIEVTRKNGEKLSAQMIHSYADFFQTLLRESPPYTFGEDSDFYSNILSITKSYWKETSDIKFPKDVVFVDRTMSGHFGNLCKFRAQGNWRKLVKAYIDACLKTNA